MVVTITGIKTNENVIQGARSDKTVNNNEIAFASEKQTQQGDVVSLSNEAKRLSKATSEQKNSMNSDSEDEQIDNGSVATGKAGSTEDADESEDSKSNVALLKKMLENAKKELEKAQNKFTEAQSKMQAASSDEEKEQAQLEVSLSKTEVSMAQASVLEIQSEIVKAQSEESKMH